MTGRLAGLRILVPESRQLDLFAGMLEAEGAVTLRCPLVTILDLADPAPVEAWLGRLIAGNFDDLILLTGEGLRRIMAVADRAGLKTETVSAIAKLRTIIRGPKPAKALRELGLAPGISADVPTTDGVIAMLVDRDLRGRAIGVQLYPGNPNDALIDFLRHSGATPDAILPYRYADDSENDRVADAIRRMAVGEIDFIALTSSPQLKRLTDVARDRGLEADLKTAFARTRVAAVGPLVAQAAIELGGTVTAMPDTNFHMKPLVNAIAAAMAG
jgi:uroporphyrinogen-III synthase